MRLTRRDSRPFWFLLLAAAITLLPPGAWSLCLDRAEGHVAIEPTAGGCLDATEAEGDACAAQSHDECVDYVIAHGQLATARDGMSVDVPPMAVLFSNPAPWVPAVLAPRETPSILPTPVASPDKPTVLRC